MPPPGVMGQPHSRPAPSGNSSDAAERPATVKSEDLQGMDDNPDDEGWAGAQEDVDYNAKINFDESDEESDNGQYTGPTSNNKKDERSVANSLKNDALTASKPAAKVFIVTIAVLSRLFLVNRVCRSACGPSLLFPLCGPIFVVLYDPRFPQKRLPT